MATSDDAYDPEMLDELRRLSNDGEDLLARIVEIFQRDAPRHLGELRAALAVNSMQRLHRSSHTFKGAAGNLGLLALAARCEAVVEATRNWESDTAGCTIGEAEIAAIEEATGQALRYLQRMVG